MKLGTVLLVGGIVGSTVGIYVFCLVAQASASSTSSSRSLYVVLLGTVGGADADGKRQRHQAQAKGGAPATLQAARPAQLDPPAAVEDAVPRVRNLFVSIIPVFGLGAGIGFLSSIMGVGGGFIMVPALIYLLKVPTNVVDRHVAVPDHLRCRLHDDRACRYEPDGRHRALAFLLMIGGVVGAQYGARAGQRLRGEQLRALLALLVLAVAIRLAFDLFVPPQSLYSLRQIGAA